MQRTDNTVTIEKLVHGGQGLGWLPDGRAAFIWNALPGETVSIQPIREKSDYLTGIAVDILAPSKDRIPARDEAYLSTSPWQILAEKAEDTHKQVILQETFARAGVESSALDIDWCPAGESWHYRNKMEYSFFGDEAGLHLALYERGTKRKQIVAGSALALPVIDEAGAAIIDVLERRGIRAGQLKSLIVRANQAGSVAVSLYVKARDFPDLTAELKQVAAGVNIHYSTPKSPASVITKTLYTTGKPMLTDSILGREFHYSVDGFFQVNVPMFERALKDIRDAVTEDTSIIDMYGGVGTIGLTVGASHVIELDQENVRMAQQNATGTDTSIVSASTEKALQYVTPEATILFDPPRSGLHPKLTRALTETLPQRIAYLSCNPATQARDIERLQRGYDVRSITGYNFFPRTPHIESLVILQKK